MARGPRARGRRAVGACRGEAGWCDANCGVGDLVEVAAERTRHSSLTAVQWRPASGGGTRERQGQGHRPAATAENLYCARGGAVRVRGARTAGPGGQQPRPRPHWCLRLRWCTHHLLCRTEPPRASDNCLVDQRSLYCTCPGPARRWSTGAELRLQVLRREKLGFGGRGTRWPGLGASRLGQGALCRCAPCRRHCPPPRGTSAPRPRAHDTERGEYWRGMQSATTTKPAIWFAES